MPNMDMNKSIFMWLVWLVYAKGTAWSLIQGRSVDWLVSRVSFLKKVNHGALVASQGQKQCKQFWQTVEFFFFLKESPGKWSSSLLTTLRSEFLCSILWLNENRADPGKERTRAESAETSEFSPPPQVHAHSSCGFHPLVKSKGKKVKPVSTKRFSGFGAG